jgi:hypothetical protein
MKGKVFLSTGSEKKFFQPNFTGRKQKRKEGRIMKTKRRLTAAIFHRALVTSLAIIQRVRSRKLICWYLHDK